jgi:hypothetical protein
MTSSAKIAFALAILMGFASFPANASPVGECTPWKPLLGTACKTRKCPVGVDRFIPETVCPATTIPPRRPIIDLSPVLPGSRGTTAPQ